VVGLAGGPEKVRQVRDLGAEIAVDYTTPDWPQQVKQQLDGRELTVVLDGVGGESGQRAFELLGIGGRLLMFGWSGGGPVQLTTEDLMNRGLSVTWSVEGRWSPLVTRYPLAKAADAHRALENRETVGKVVLIP
jgi:NADPH2:quinone reductase